MEYTNPDTAPLLKAVADASQYCYTVENALAVEPAELIKSLVTLLPQLYLDFIGSDIEADDDFSYTPMLDEQAYDRVRSALQRQLGAEDIFLETFEEDMKFSDTPIAVSISETLADIYQDLYEFTMQVRLSDGEALTQAFGACRENFRLYWAQKLCNVLRPLNALCIGGFNGAEED